MAVPLRCQWRGRARHGCRQRRAARGRATVTATAIAAGRQPQRRTRHHRIASRRSCRVNESLRPDGCRPPWRTRVAGTGHRTTHEHRWTGNFSPGYPDLRIQLHPRRRHAKRQGGLCVDLLRRHTLAGLGTGGRPARIAARGTGHVVGAAGSHQRDAEGRCGCQQGSGRRAAGGAPWQGRALRRGRQSRPFDGCAHDAGCDLSHLLDEQARHHGGGHDARRGRPAQTRRPREQVHPVLRKAAGRRREARPGRRPAPPSNWCRCVVK